MNAGRVKPAWFPPNQISGFRLIPRQVFVFTFTFSALGFFLVCNFFPAVRDIPRLFFRYSYPFAKMPITNTISLIKTLRKGSCSRIWKVEHMTGRDICSVCCVDQKSSELMHLDDDQSLRAKNFPAPGWESNFASSASCIKFSVA